jgi:hypothetical protein
VGIEPGGKEAHRQALHHKASRPPAKLAITFADTMSSAIASRVSVLTLRTGRLVNA